MKQRRFPRSPNTDKGPFIASRLPIRNRFHPWDCPWVAEMELKNRPPPPLKVSWIAIVSVPQNAMLALGGRW